MTRCRHVRVGPARIGSPRVGPGRVGSGRPGPGRAGSGRAVPRRLAPALGVVVVVLGVVVPGTPSRAGPDSGTAGGFGTPLPQNWEQCILTGVGAPPTPENVANLDAWQAAEGGSTDNAAAYNPFNTGDATDKTGASLPTRAAPGSFPAFTTWQAGCAATVATLLQPNMSPVTSALRAGDVAPSGFFLYDVDKSAWCAPSADGLPCYADKILAAELLGALLGGHAGALTDALASYSETSGDLGAYKGVAFTEAVDQHALAVQTQALDAVESQVSVAQSQVSVATVALRRLALRNYTDDGIVRPNANLQMFGPSDVQGVLSDYYGEMAASVLVGRYDRALASLQAWSARQAAATTQVAQTTSELASVQAAADAVLSRLDADMKAIEVAKSCTSPSLVVTAASPVGGQENIGQLWGALQACLAPSPRPGGPTPGH